MLRSGKLVRWRSAKGRQLRLAAAAPSVPWTDLTYALVPNGSTLDYVADAPYVGRLGVMKESYVNALYLVGCETPTSFCTDDRSTLEPRHDACAAQRRASPDTDPALGDMLEEIQTFHSSYSIDDSQPPAPLLIQNGWTDDLFPVDEALRFYNRTKTNHPRTPVSLFFADIGHMRGPEQARGRAALRLGRAQVAAPLRQGQGPQALPGRPGAHRDVPVDGPVGRAVQGAQLGRAVPGRGPAERRAGADDPADRRRPRDRPHVRRRHRQRLRDRRRRHPARRGHLPAGRDLELHAARLADGRRRLHPARRDLAGRCAAARRRTGRARRRSSPAASGGRRSPARRAGRSSSSIRVPGSSLPGTGSSWSCCPTTRPTAAPRTASSRSPSPTWSSACPRATSRARAPWCRSRSRRSSPPGTGSRAATPGRADGRRRPPSRRSRGPSAAGRIRGPRGGG